MVALLLAAAISVQQTPVRISATLDRTDATVGDEIVLTLTVESIGNQPVQIPDPPLLGLQILGSSQRSDVSVQGGEFTRTTIRSLRLLALREGTATVGPITARLGAYTSAAPALQVDVIGGGAGRTATLDPHVREFILRQPAPAMRADEVRVQILVTKSSLVLGDQLDLIVLAWFPREIREKLRTPPTLHPPQLQGAWVYQRGIPGATAMSRRVNGVSYDLFAHHTVVFPLTPGTFEIGPATVSYSLPLTLSFLSREVRHEPQSDPISIAVDPQPATGRPIGFAGTAAAQLEFTLEVMPQRLALGGAGSVVLALRGRGNVALWPEPTVSWPEGIRVYPENVEVELAPEDGAVAGVKRFNYMVVADSVGTHRIPSPTYRYYDLAASAYTDLTLEPADILVEGSSIARAESPRRTIALADATSEVSVRRIVTSFPWLFWVVLVLSPPLLLVAVSTTRRLRRRAKAATTAAESGIAQAEVNFREALSMLVPDADSRGGGRLAGALRAVGVETPVAQHAARVRDRLWQASYGPHGEIDPDELIAEIEEVVKALKAQRADNILGIVGAGLALALVGALLPAQTNAQTPERLYESGAFAAAADSFELRAASEPWSASHLQNLGSCAYLLGDLGRAKVAWTKAARLNPRSSELRELLALIPSSDASTRTLLWVFPASPSELLAVAGLVWLAGWVALAFAGRRIALALLLCAVTCGTLAGYVRLRYTNPVGVVVADDTPLRWAPYGPAPARAVMEAAAAVRITRTEGNWLLVQLGSLSGWVMQDEIEAL